MEPFYVQINGSSTLSGHLMTPKSNPGILLNYHDCTTHGYQLDAKIKATIVQKPVDLKMIIIVMTDQQEQKIETQLKFPLM